ILRLITLAMGIASLFVIRRILRQLRSSPFVQNSVLFFLSLVGALLWVFSSVNYDVPALLLYWLAVSVAISMLGQKGISAKRIMYFAMLGMLCVLTKVTFLTFIGLLVIFTIILTQRNLGLKFDIQWSRVTNVALVAVLLVVGFLFIERIGGNIVQYRQVEV